MRVNSRVDAFIYLTSRRATSVLLVLFPTFTSSIFIYTLLQGSTRATEIRTHIFSSSLIISQLASEGEHVTRPIGRSCRSRVQCVPIVTARAGEIDSTVCREIKRAILPTIHNESRFACENASRACSSFLSPSLPRPRYPFLFLQC